MPERDFKGVWIPKELWLNQDLSIIEKCLLVEIDSLDNDEDKGCFASNEYLGNFIGVSSGRCANMISDLKKRGFIRQVFFDGRNRGLRINGNIVNERESSLHENVKPTFTKTLKQPSRKREHNNTVINKEEKGEHTPAPAFTSVPKFITPTELEERLREFYKAYPEEWNTTLETAKLEYFKRGRKFDAAECKSAVASYCEWVIEETKMRYKDFGAHNARLRRWLRDQAGFGKEQTNTTSTKMPAETNPVYIAMQSRK